MSECAAAESMEGIARRGATVEALVGERREPEGRRCAEEERRGGPEDPIVGERL